MGAKEIPGLENARVHGKQLYAVVDSADEVAVRLKGVGGADLYNVPFRDIGAVVGDSAARSGATAFDDIIRYERAVERLMDRYTVLPARFPTVFEGEDKVAAALSQNYARLKDNLDGVRGKLEFGVRVLRGDAKVFMPAAPEEPDALTAAISGKDYMHARVTGYRLEKALRTAADGYIRAMDSHFMGVAAEKTVEMASGGRLMLSAAYLVEVERSREFNAAFHCIRATFPELMFLLSGPWPPYNFVQDIREAQGDGQA